MISRKNRQGGYLLIKNADDRGKDVECDTFTCRHCNKIVAIKPMCDPVELGGRCSGCDGLLCPNCASKVGCTHIEHRMDVIERRESLAKSLRS